MSDAPQDLIVRTPPTEVNTLAARMEDMVRAAAASNDPSSIFQEISMLRKDAQLKGVMVAKLLSDLWDVWPTLQGVDASFNGYVEAASAETGLRAKTIKPYIRMWKAIFANKQVPAGARAALFNFPVATLLYLQPAAQDGTLDGKWKDVIECETPGEVKDMVRDLRGTNTSSETAVRIVLSHDGRLRAKRGSKGNYIPIGHLALDSENEIAKIAITRIITAAGIVELD